LKEKEPVSCGNLFSKKRFLALLMLPFIKKKKEPWVSFF
jgi:hypothetical protein